MTEREAKNWTYSQGWALRWAYGKNLPAKTADWYCPYDEGDGYEQWCNGWQDCHELMKKAGNA